MVITIQKAGGACRIAIPSLEYAGGWMVSTLIE
jgi:hypothetical protein